MGARSLARSHLSRWPYTERPPCARGTLGGLERPTCPRATTKSGRRRDESRPGPRPRVARSASNDRRAGQFGAHLCGRRSSDFPQNCREQRRTRAKMNSAASGQQKSDGGAEWLAGAKQTDPAAGPFRCSRAHLTPSVRAKRDTRGDGGLRSGGAARGRHSMSAGARSPARWSVRPERAKSN